MVLADGKIGQSYHVDEIKLEEDLKRRLQILGLTQGTSLELLNRKRNGSVIFKVRGTRFAIGKHVACGIEVYDNE